MTGNHCNYCVSCVLLMAALSLRKEVIALRITFHIGNFTVTIIIKERKNRHSAK